ncbi:MAG: LysM peptidoglycan-binding domain-containing protein [Bacillota bacterium]
MKGGPSEIADSRVPDRCPSGWRRYTVRSGDTMFSIARRFGVSLDQLIRANQHIADPTVIFPGDVLCVPDNPAVDPPGRAPDRCPPGWRRYTVRSGDTMFSIAERFGVSLDQLIRANPHITDPAVIFPGDVLCVPS